ncbi:uncharacterized protein G2W53_041061 [Senna tora]|uniref:Uncharacterized protein n=1 Tax=Senna tora TaxID=362788 RepID=A0A834VYW3_9FABA|nr:uncharacterized protein G2W53_041061 [Senna tora]
MENIQGQFTILSAGLIAKQNDMDAHVTKLANSISEIQAKLNSMPSNTAANSKALNAISLWSGTIGCRCNECKNMDELLDSDMPTMECLCKSISTVMKGMKGQKKGTLYEQVVIRTNMAGQPAMTSKPSLL